MAIFQNNLLAGAGAQSSGGTTHSIDQSIRFNSADDGNMYRVVGSGGNTKTWTFSGWFKLGLLGSQRGASPFLWSGYQDDSNRTQLMLDNSVGTGAAGDFLCLYSTTGGNIFQTTRVFRDPSAWYHIVVVSDTSNAVASERIRLYINGIRETSFSTINYPSLNADLAWNKNGSTWYLGKYHSGSGSGTYNYDGYMAELVNLDGTATDCTSFGEFNSSGIWVPKDVSGLTFGTKGWYIDGRDSSDLGDDESGQGNDFTVSGLAAHDQVFDTPTNNFCVMNPVSLPSVDSGQTLRGVSGVNLSSISKPSGNTNGFAFGTMGVTSGKWYYELYTTTYPAVEALGLGWIDAENSAGAASSGSGWRDFGINQRHTTSAYSVWQWGYNESTGTGLTEFQASVVVGVATDFDNNTFTLTTNGSAYGSVDFDSTSPTQDLTDGTVWLPKSVLANDAVALVTFNFGQDSTFNGQITAGGNADGNNIGNFKYSVPSGYLALCTKNLGS